MVGRDPREHHRAATPLELLFDLVFVVAFATAANEMAYFLADEKYLAGIVGFVFSMSGICWAWISFTRFASGFDTDDWAYRIATMVQMIGVVIFALGIPAAFASLDGGARLDNGVLVAGYVVMRVALVALWLRAAATQPAYRRTARGTAGAIIFAQSLWVVTAVLPLPIPVFFACVLGIFLIEFAAPLVIQRRHGEIPWHAHHVAERYGLLTIIALGEGVLGTVIAVAVVVDEQGWSVDAIAIVVAGIGLTFGLWWVYFMTPSAQALERFRERQYGWGLLHVPLFMGITAVGAGLHVVAYVIEDKATISSAGAVTVVGVAVVVSAVMMAVIYGYATGVVDVFHLRLGLGALAVVAFAVTLAWLGVATSVSLLVLTLAPAVAVVGFEVAGRRHQEELLAAMLERPDA